MYKVLYRIEFIEIYEPIPAKVYNVTFYECPISSRDIQSGLRSILQFVDASGIRTWNHRIITLPYDV